MQSCVNFSDLALNFSDLALDVDIFGAKSTIHPVLLWDSEGATLVDSGFPGTFPQLKQAVEQRISAFSRIKRVILTHQDWDHTGTIPDIQQALAGKVQILAHAQEKPYLEGSLPHYKLTPERIAARIQSLPEQRREQAKNIFANLPKFKVDQTVKDGEVLPIHGGIEVIHVPGHTPGNITLYVRSCRLLIAGDQLRVENGRLVGPAPEYTPDMPTAMQSLKKLLTLDIDTVVCYHGGTWTANPAARIAEMASI